MCITKDAGWCDAIECDDIERMIECLEQEGYTVIKDAESNKANAHPSD